MHSYSECVPHVRMNLFCACLSVMKCPFLVAVFIIVLRPPTPIWHLHNPWNPSSAFVCCACYDSLSTAPWVQPHEVPLSGRGSGPVGEMAGPSRVDAKVAQYFHCWFFWSSSSGTTRCESGSLLLKSVSRGHSWWWHPLDSTQSETSVDLPWIWKVIPTKWLVYFKPGLRFCLVQKYMFLKVKWEYICIMDMNHTTDHAVCLGEVRYCFSKGTDFKGGHIYCCSVNFCIIGNL